VIVDVVVMAHPSRAPQALALARQIDALTAWDERNDEWDNGARAWRTTDPAADWAVVVQDDAVPVPNFRHHLERALAKTPRTGISLYVGTGRPRAERVRRAAHEATRQGASWLECDSLLWGVAIALPAEHVDPMLDWAQHQRQPYDQRISAWYRRSRKQPVRMTWPSLVDHADGPTLVKSGRPAVPRHAHLAAEPEHDWSGPVVKV